ncbi:hypothetical protein [Litorisediminicola beolgyonensis]|uniref:Uncharacterized protein n=1 Tax=Litorisediminicola beolgyonensis TaxID=1173614 RepID=A0ABW3ZKJ0_9RHOB
MPDPAAPPRVNVMIVGQSGRLGYEAALFALSFTASGSSDRFRLWIAEPQPGGAWPGDPRIADPALRALIEEAGGTVLPFEARHFGASYPYGNKIEALKALPEGEPFVFFDTDTLILDALDQVPFDFDRPTASLRREGTWPEIELYGPGYAAIWKSLYDRFGLDFESSLDLSEPDEYWRRYLYFNAGFFFYRCPRVFGDRFLETALAIRDDPPPELVCQSLDPWLDQVALPLVIHALGGGRDALPEGLLDGSVSCHYRLLPLLYAREDARVVGTLETICAPNKVKKVLKSYEPIKRMIYQGRGEKVRALFDQADLPRKEQAIRNRIKREGFWMR